MMTTMKQTGFTLIEMMIVVVIISILAGIAYPSYTRYVTDTRRATAQSFLLQAAGQQEKFFTQCGYYASNFDGVGDRNQCNTLTTGGALGMKSTQPDLAGLYVFSSTINPAGTAFTLTATPQGTQATNDSGCGNIELTSQGEKKRTGPNPIGRCWKK